MPESHSIFFLGGDTRTRAGITRDLAGNGWQVTPANSFDEIDAVPSSGGVILCFVEDAREVARLQAQMAHRGYSLPIITCSGTVNHRLIVKAIQSGAQGHLIWPFEIEEFARVLAEAEDQMNWQIHRQSAKLAAQKRLEPLSPRERDVLAALARFGSNKKIALELDLSPRTVEIYRSKIMQRLGVDHVAQALWIAFQSEEFAAGPFPSEPGRDNTANLRFPLGEVEQSSATSQY